MRSGISGFSVKPVTRAVFIHGKNPVSLGFFKGHLQGGNGDVGLVHPVEFDHLGHVHLVNVVATEDRHIIRIRRFDKAQVLKDGIGRPFKPLFAFAAGFGRNTDEEITQASPFPPGFPKVLVQRVRPVLGEDINLLDAGIEKVGEDEVDDLVFPAKSDTRLGPAQSERTESFTFAAGQHHRDRVPAQIIHRIHR